MSGLKDKNTKNKDLRIKIYHLALNTILKHKCPSLIYKQFGTNNILNIVLQKTYKEDIEIWYTNSFKQYYYPILAALIIDYEKQVLITGIKANMQYLLYYILQKERKIVTKL